MDLFKEWVLALPASKLGKLGALLVLGAVLKDGLGSTVVFSNYIDWVFNAWTGLGGLAIMAIQKRGE